MAAAPQIWVLDNFLTAEEVVEYRRVVDSYRRQGAHPIYEDKKGIVSQFWERFGARLRDECGVQRLTNFVTVSRSSKALEWHYDNSKDGDTHKVLVYLDDVAGTLFRVDGGVRAVEAHPGRVVVFDFRLEHAGDTIPPGRGDKYTLGFRACRG
jgi:hypothetical protein